MANVRVERDTGIIEPSDTGQLAANTSDAPVSSTPVSSTPVSSAPVSSAPVSSATVNSMTANTDPATDTSSSADTGATDESSATPAPVDDNSKDATRPHAVSRPEPDANLRPSVAAEDTTEERLGDAQRAFLIMESEHFFRGELAHEQRAAWLLALASGLLLAIWRLLSSASTEQASNLAFGLLVATLFSLSLAVALSLWALWPLAGGKHPRQLEPWGRDSAENQADKSLPPIPKRILGPIAPTVWNHYLAHRRRAEVKGRRVVRINITLFVSLLLGTAGILATLFERSG